MKAVIIFIAFALALASAFDLYPLLKPQLASGDVIAGVDAEAGEAPYIVSIQGTAGDHFCAGCVIAENWILTAGHCLVYNEIRVVAGLHKRSDESQVQIRTATSADYRIHAEFSGGAGPNDIGLVYIAEQFNFHELRTDNSKPLVKAVRLPKGQFTEESTEGVLFGWGYSDSSNTLPNTLQKLDTFIINYEQCKSALPSNAAIDPSNICSSNGKTIHSACNGDSGGPLVQYNSSQQPEIIGIVSWGYTPCTISTNPSVYTSTGNFIQWIESNKIPTVR